VSRLGRRGFLTALACASSAGALGRTPFGATLRLRLPLYFGGIDPHLLDDPLSALFAPAIADPLYAFDAIGKPYPALANALPEHTSRGARISLRPELLSARGKALSAADIVFSFKRAQALGGAAVLGTFRPPSIDHKDALSALFPDADPVELARALASPLTALVPRGFSPSTPDGTGAFKATVGNGTLTLLRNENAARAAAFLERIELSRAADLADALRAFEAGSVDVGWLGNGLYRARAGAVPLEGPVFGWIVLRTGLDAKTWGAPGIAQQLAATLPSEALSHFGVRALPGPGEGVHWGGGPATLLVCDDAPHALELGRALEPLLSSSGNEVRVNAVPRATWLDARRTRRFALLLDFVRSASSDPTQATQALLAAVDPALAKHPPRNSSSLRELTRTLSLGIVGEVRVSGSRVAAFEGLETWQLGGVWFNELLK
jgi:peptide/nickel transport system substrate-binding protein